MSEITTRADSLRRLAEKHWKVASPDEPQTVMGWTDHVATAQALEQLAAAFAAAGDLLPALPHHAGEALRGYTDSCSTCRAIVEVLDVLANEPPDPT